MIFEESQSRDLEVCSDLLQLCSGDFIRGFVPNAEIVRRDTFRYLRQMGVAATSCRNCSCNRSNGNCTGNCAKCSVGSGFPEFAPELVILTDSCINETVSAIRPAASLFACQMMIFADQNRIETDCFSITSQSLAKHVAGCSVLAVFAATIGSAPDLLIRKYQMLDVARVPCIQAAGAAIIELFCDYINSEIITIVNSHGYDTVSRFSPGYGDLPIDIQRSIFELPGMARQTGIRLTESMLMMPSKSVTAFIGIAKLSPHS